MKPPEFPPDREEWYPGLLGLRFSKWLKKRRNRIMKTLKDELIAKQKLLILRLIQASYPEFDYDETFIKNLQDEIAVLEKQIAEQPEITDEDIEEAARDYASSALGLAGRSDFNIETAEEVGFIDGAKAMRDGEIKHIEK